MMVEVKKQQQPDLEQLPQSILADMIYQLLAEKKYAEEQLKKLHDYFQSLGDDPHQNIQTIVEQLGTILGSDCALYNRLEENKSSPYLVTWAIYNQPPDFKREDEAEGHICYEAVIKGKSQVKQLAAVALTNLDHRLWVHTDVNVKKYGLKSYLGFPVTYNDRFIGSLCVVDTTCRDYTLAEQQVIATLAKAVSIEEVRYQHLQDLHRDMREMEQHLKEVCQANSTRDKLLSIIAHDLRNPLNGVLGLSSLLIEDFTSFPPDTCLEMVQQIHHSAGAMFSLLENLLAWARQQTGQLQCKPILFDLHPLSIHIVFLFSGAIAHKNIRVHNEITPGTMVYADENMIHTVLRNLLSNAIKFTPAEGLVNLSAHLQYGQWSVEITDSGVGMSAEAQEKLFHLAANHSTPGTQGEKGTGLGLAVCKDLVEKNGGALNIRSQLHCGSTFSFTLPCAEQT